MNLPPDHQSTGRVISLKLVGAISLVDGLFFSLTSPKTGNSSLIIVGTCLLVAGMYAWSALFVRVLAAFWPLRLRTKRHLAVFLAILVSVLIIMQSIGQLSWRDGLAIIPFAVALYAYVAYLAAHQPTGSSQLGGS